MKSNPKKISMAILMCIPHCTFLIFLPCLEFCQCNFDNLALIVPCSSAGLTAFVIICSCCSLNIAPRLIGLRNGPA